MSGGTVTLPWPDSRLSPNARVHYYTKAGIAKNERRAAFYLAKSAGCTAPENGPIRLRIVFHPPDRRPRDLDNALAALKAGIDGIAQALGVNDSRFVPSVEWGEPRKPGRVEVTILPV